MCKYIYKLFYLFWKTKKVECKLCEEVFDLESSLKFHMRGKCTSMKVWRICEIVVHFISTCFGTEKVRAAMIENVLWQNVQWNGKYKKWFYFRNKIGH